VQSYIYWALLGMVGYSLTMLFTKLAERSGEASSYMVLAASSIIVAIIVIAIVGFRGELWVLGDLPQDRARARGAQFNATRS
jgi:bacterial/archaeal transporter family protein